MNTNNTELKDIIATMDRIIEKLDKMNERLDMAMEIIDNKSSNTTTTDEDYLSSTMYGVDNKQ